MTYRVISDFTDFLGDGQQYKSGDIYPHSGAADEARVKHLMTPTSQRGSLLEVVKDEKPVEKSVEKPVSKKKKEK